MAIPEMAGDYEILQSVRLGGRMMLLGYNPRDKDTPYMTCYQQYNLLGEKIFPQAVAGDNYVEILQIFLNRLQEQQKAVAEFREKRGVPIEVLGAVHCRERGEKESLEGKLIIFRPTSLAAEYRTADCQLGYAVGSFGCSAGSRGRAVYFQELFSGERCRWDASDVLGIADFTKLPDWAIPIKKVHKDGVFEVAGLYSKTWRFFDVNYAVAGPEKKEALFLSYCAFLNSLPVRALVKITLFNRTMNQQEFSRNLLMQMVGDGKDRYRAEYNDILTDNAASSNNLTQEKYITISVERKNIEEARAFFNRVGTELGTYLSRMDVKVRDTNVVERMRLFHDFFRPHDSDFRFDLNNIIHRGNDFRDAIAPDCMTFYKDHYEMGDQVGRVLFLRDYASFIKDEMITELSDLPRNKLFTTGTLNVFSHQTNINSDNRLLCFDIQDLGENLKPVGLLVMLDTIFNRVIRNR